MAAAPVKFKNDSAPSELSTVHKLPCKIEHDGPARISDLFAVAEDGTSSFRGKKLESVRSPLPEGYTGIVLSKSRTTTDAEEDEFHLTHSFKEIISWGWDSKPSSMNFDKLVSIQNALHKR